MLRPKKTIPSLAVTTLALTGCGDGDDSGGAYAGALRDFCMKGQECFPEYTVDECIDFYESLISEYNVTPSCEEALISYFSCGAALSCEELGMENNSCTDEYNAIFDDCLLNVE
jgi:hypothetical protein